MSAQVHELKRKSVAPHTAGRAATINIGTVTSGTPAAVVNRGTPIDAIFDFTIPPGERGGPGDAEPSLTVGAVTPPAHIPGKIWTTETGELFIWNNTAWVQNQMTVMSFPTSPANGQEHIEGGKIYRFDAAINAWLVIGIDIFTDAPSDGELYGRQDKTWVAVTITHDGGVY